jgi:hypothetical protein
MTNLTVTPKNQQVPLPPAPALPFTVKADTKQYLKSLGPARIILALGITIIFWVRLGPLGWLISVVSIAALIIFIIFMLTRREITVNNEGVHYKNSFGATKSTKFEEIEAVQILDNYFDPGFGVMPRILVGKKSGGVAFSIIGIFWPYEGMTKLLSAFKAKNVVLNFYIDQIQSTQVAKEFPKLVPFYEQHPYWVAMISVVVIFAAITIGVLLFVI